MVSVTFSALLRMSAKMESEGFLTMTDTASSSVRLEAAWPQYSTVQYSTVQYSTVQYLAAVLRGLLHLGSCGGGGLVLGNHSVLGDILLLLTVHREHFNPSSES